MLWIDLVAQRLELALDLGLREPPLPGLNLCEMLGALMQLVSLG